MRGLPNAPRALHARPPHRPAGHPLPDGARVFDGARFGGEDTLWPRSGSRILPRTLRQHQKSPHAPPLPSPRRGEGGAQRRMRGLQNAPRALHVRPPHRPAGHPLPDGARVFDGARSGRRHTLASSGASCHPHHASTKITARDTPSFAPSGRRWRAAPDEGAFDLSACLGADALLALEPIGFAPFLLGRTSRPGIAFGDRSHAVRPGQGRR